MSEMQAPTAIDRIKNLSEATRNTIALGIWLVVLVGLLFVSVHGQSKLMTAGLFLQFTGAYSTFLLCGRSKYSPLVHEPAHSGNDARRFGVERFFVVSILNHGR